MKIAGFYHICQYGNWLNIVPEQWQTFKDSGLYDASDKIYVVHNGIEDLDRAPELPDGLINKIATDPKIIYLTVNTKQTFEYPTLLLLQREAIEAKEPFYLYYMHSKGIATANHEIKNGAWWWRKYMEHYNITKWKDCVAALNEGHDVCGVEWRTVPLKHFSGNFWWATSEYIKTLPDCQQWWNKHRHDRIMAEMFIGLSNPKFKCFKNTKNNLYLYECTPDQWN